MLIRDATHKGMSRINTWRFYVKIVQIASKPGLAILCCDFYLERPIMSIKPDQIPAIAILLISVISSNVGAQGPGDKLTMRMEQVVARINSNTTDIASVFSADFNSKIGDPAMQKIFLDLHENVGRCAVFAQVAGQQPIAASYLLRCEKGIVPVDLSIELQAPHLISGLFIHKTYIETPKEIPATHP
ncbi:hypothetical protein [Verminephrobacter eiseniae]|uniref:hypothetical protein n=1 Tax=Verminephrobacter eiseniae TaxID=364317 RepID=UPI00223735AB|nr:hypothetical protein [Verminephrobacter eiseniae]